MFATFAMPCPCPDWTLSNLHSSGLLFGAPGSLVAIRFGVLAVQNALKFNHTGDAQIMASLLGRSTKIIAEQSSHQVHGNLRGFFFHGARRFTMSFYQPHIQQQPMRRSYEPPTQAQPSMSLPSASRVASSCPFCDQGTDPDNSCVQRAPVWVSSS